jgi:hypothetical protein
MQDLQTILNIVFGLFSACVGWFAREMWSAVKELKSDLAKLREDLPKEYVAKDDYRQDTREIKEMLSKIFDRLDSKADK